MAANAADFDFIRRFVSEKTGIQVGTDKDYLIESRLTPVLHKHGLTDFGALAQRVTASPCFESRDLLISRKRVRVPVLDAGSSASRPCDCMSRN